MYRTACKLHFNELLLFVYYLLCLSCPGFVVPFPRADYPDFLYIYNGDMAITSNLTAVRWLVKNQLGWGQSLRTLFTSPSEDMGLRHGADVWFVAMADGKCALFYAIFWGGFGSTVCLLGIIGSILSFIVFQWYYDKIRTPAQTLVQCLSISDCLLLLLVLSLDCISYICDYASFCSNPWTSWPYVRYIWIMTPISHMCSVWFVVLIALNRYWAVCRAFDFDRVWTNRTTGFSITLVITLVFLFNIPRWFEYRIVTYQSNSSSAVELKEERSDFSRTFAYLIGYKVLLVNVLLIFVPLCIIALLTAFILRRLYVNSQRIATPTSWRTSAHVTRVLMAVVTVSVICQMPLAVFNFVRYSSYGCGEVVFYLDHVSKLLVNINSCLNFFLYCIFSCKFRQQFETIVCCGRRSCVITQRRQSKDIGFRTSIERRQWTTLDDGINNHQMLTKDKTADNGAHNHPLLEMEIESIELVNKLKQTPSSATPDFEDIDAE